MSWGQAIDAAGVTAAASPAESARFGLAIDRITVSATSRATEAELLDAVQASSADVLIVRYPAEQVTWFAALAAQRRRTALLADSLVYWRLTPGLGRRPAGGSQVTSGPVPATAAGTAVAERLVAEIFTDYRNHYLADPLFDHDRAREGYQEWACRSLAGAQSITMYEAPGDTNETASDANGAGAEPRGGEPVGLCVGEVDGAHYEILLAGIVPGAQGRGLYGHLLAAVEDRAADQGLDAVVISTQGHNTRVQRAWARYGFEPVHTLLTVHLVRPELLQDAPALRRRVTSAATEPAPAGSGPGPLTAR